MVDVDFSDLTDAERLLWDAFPRSEWVDLRDGDAAVANRANSGSGRVIRASVIRALLLGAAEAKPGWAPGVRLRGAVVKGCLDLMGATVAWPLTCEHC